ncbi:MFS transporter [Gephyromycinifex aptenodytis]|uniref:MFS transporter n=1 Tax=Gephyromycinifex aptenodytis TaxID=2716227 RepID=UPI001D0251AC|nr:MFS transporter [Gephyromycinifex aptenodytis]
MPRTSPAAATAPPHTDEERRSLHKAFVASLSGTSLEWYDFALFGAVTGTVFSKLFFDGSDPAMDTIKAFMTYGAGYIARPIGGIFFGRLGDVIGRKKVLVWTLLLIGLATAAIGILPTYASAGIWAPILLVTMRFLQGVGVGGEWGGAVLLSSEFARPGTRGLWASAAQTGVPLGSFMANSLVLVLTASMSQETFLAWGWRLAFGLSLILVGFGLWIRHKLEETPVFQRLAEQGDAPKAPITEVFRTQGRALVGAILVRFGPDVLYAFFAIYVITWLQSGPNKLTYGQALTCTMSAAFIQIFCMPLAGWVSDRIERKKLYGMAAVAAAIWIFVFLAVLQNRNFVLALAGVIIGLVIHCFMYAPQAAHIAEQFHARLRYTGSSLAYTFAGVFGGGIAPVMFALFHKQMENSWLIGAWVAGACLITLIGLAMSKTVIDDADQVLLSGSSEDDTAGQVP